MLKTANFYHWDKGDPDKLSEHFSCKEFECPCVLPTCGTQSIEVSLIDKLTRVRKLMGRPLKITSGYRCHAHQLALAAKGYETAPGLSQHELGRAADIVLPGATLYQFAALLHHCEQEFSSIGEALSFLHVDLRVDKPGRRWYYGIRK